jgi:hypothetical protein
LSDTGGPLAPEQIATKPDGLSAFFYFIRQPIGKGLIKFRFFNLLIGFGNQLLFEIAICFVAKFSKAKKAT